MYTEEETIRAYLLNQLPPQETAKFKEQIEQDPELKAKVKGWKLVLLNNERIYQHQLRQEMKTWRLPPPVIRPWWKRPWVLASLLAAVVVVVLIYQWVYDPPTVPPTPSPATPIAGADDCKPDEANTSDLSAGGNTLADERFFIPSVRPVWLEGILQAANPHPRSGLLASRSAQMDISSTAYLGRPDSTSFGFFTSYRGSDYYLCSAADLGLSAFRPGVSAKVRINNETIELPLLALDGFYDIAVLALPDSAQQDRNLLKLALSNDQTDLQGQPLYLLRQRESSAEPELATGAVIGPGRDIFSIQTTDPVERGPVVHSDGQVMGIVTHFQMDAQSSKTVDVVSSSKIQLLLDRVANDQPYRAYLGIGFAEDRETKAIRIIRTAPMSPAARYEDELTGHRVTAINDIPVEDMESLKVILDRLRPGEQIWISHLDQEGTVRRNQITARTMDENAFHDIAKAVLSKFSGSLSYKENSEPTVEYLGGMFPSGRYRIIGLCATEPQCWENIRTHSELGERLRLAGYVARGSLYLFPENSDSNKIQMINLSFENPVLWY